MKSLIKLLMTTIHDNNTLTLAIIKFLLQLLNECHINHSTMTLIDHKYNIVNPLYQALLCGVHPCSIGECSAGRVHDHVALFHRLCWDHWYCSG